MELVQRLRRKGANQYVPRSPKGAAIPRPIQRIGRMATIEDWIFHRLYDFRPKQEHQKGNQEGYRQESRRIIRDFIGEVQTSPIFIPDKLGFSLFLRNFAERVKWQKTANVIAVYNLLIFSTLTHRAKFCLHEVQPTEERNRKLSTTNNENFD